MKWDCEECREMGLDVQRGCNPGTKATSTIRTASSGEFDRCPKAWVREDVPFAAQYLSDYRWLKEYGVMPKAGGKIDQSPRFISAIDVIENEIARINSLEIERVSRRRGK